MVGDNKGQMKIQQMAFMIIAVFIFFVLAGVFFINIRFSDLGESASQLQKEQAISSLKVIADMPELNCNSRESLCLDRDKLRVMAGSFGSDYDLFWPIASLKVYEVYPASDNFVKCPTVDCNYYEVFDNGQENVIEYSTFVSICEKLKEESYVYDRCEIGKLVVGVKGNE